MFSKISAKMSSIANFFSSWAIFALMIIGIIGITARYAGAPISGIISISLFVFIGSVFLSLAFVQLRESHVAVTFLVIKLPKKMQFVLKIVAAFFSALACFMLVWAIWPFAWESFMYGERMSGEPYYPIYPVKLCAALGLSILFVQVFFDFIKS